MRRRRRLLEPPEPGQDRRIHRSTRTRRGYLTALSRVAGGDEVSPAEAPDPARLRVRIVEADESDRVA